MTGATELRLIISAVTQTDQIVEISIGHFDGPVDLGADEKRYPISNVETIDAALEKAIGTAAAAEKVPERTILFDEIDIRTYPRAFQQLLRQLPKFTGISFTCCLDDDLFESLLPALALSRANYFYSHGSNHNAISDRSLVAMAGLSIPGLNLCHNAFTDQGIREFACRCRERGSGPARLDLDSAVRFRDPEALRDVLTLPGLQELELTSTGLTGALVENVLAPALETEACSELRLLRIHNNSSIDDKAYLRLTRALQLNEGLRTLVVDHEQPLVPEGNCTLTLGQSVHHRYRDPISLRNFVAADRARSRFAAVVAAATADADADATAGTNATMAWLPSLYQAFLRETVRGRKRRHDAIEDAAPGLVPIGVMRRLI